jgi:hypothetical protein
MLPLPSEKQRETDMNETIRDAAQSFLDSCSDADLLPLHTIRDFKELYKLWLSYRHTTSMQHEVQGRMQEIVRVIDDVPLLNSYRSIVLTGSEPEKIIDLHIDSILYSMCEQAQAGTLDPPQWLEKKFTSGINVIPISQKHKYI